MIDLYFGNPDEKPGTWKGGTMGSGRRIPIISCPKCGGVAPLSNHEIDNNGVISPSVVCLFEGCNFHDYIKIKGWTTKVPK